MLLMSNVATYSSEITTITILLDSAGSALWTVEDRFILATEEEEELFEEFQKDEALKEEKLNEFKEKMSMLLERIKYATKRSMNMSNFEIFMGKEVSVTNTYGVILFRFTWDEFAVAQDGQLIVGDVFEGGYYISMNELLVVQFPESYRLVTATPSPDHQKETMLIWEGPMNFADGHPAVVVEKQRSSIADGKWLIPVLAAILLSVGIMALRSRKHPAESVTYSPYVDDRKLIIDVVRQHGGKIPQKELPDLTGFSKAKISILLKELKKEGIIRKTFRGRENEIVLVDRESD
ncbi:MAG: hypothetical protein HXS49_08520 [Theionarchaea archaeon]|nr:hypothetical protein [Theionarchaea archaeon]MBU6999834.1 hypothetical protein [Theionarchaea archaeon]MBU7035220.1 hypothetical protein [Theionarchaea archaeon]